MRRLPQRPAVRATGPRSAQQAPGAPVTKPLWRLRFYHPAEASPLDTAEQPPFLQLVGGTSAAGLLAAAAAALGPLTYRQQQLIRRRLLDPRDPECSVVVLLSNALSSLLLLQRPAARYNCFTDTVPAFPVAAAAGGRIPVSRVYPEP